MLACKNIQVNDSVILYDGNAFGVLIQSIQPDQIINTRYGHFNHNDIINKPYGSKVYDRKTRKWLVACKLTPDLLTLVLQRRTQIIYSTDIPVILALLDAKPGDVIFESGTGSGSLTIHLAHSVYPNGSVYTFEFHEERFQKAQQDFISYKLDNIIHCFHQNVYKQGFFTNVPIYADSIFLDLPQPWLALTHCHSSLKPLGRLVTFSPCIEQIQNTVQMLRTLKFTDIHVYETIAKPWGIIKAATQHVKTIEEDLLSDDSPEINQEIKNEVLHAAVNNKVWDEKIQAFKLMGKQFQCPTKGHTSYILSALKSPIPLVQPPVWRDS